MKLPDALRPLAQPTFRIYWLGQALSLVGTWMQQMALGWVVTRLTSSASLVGTLAVVGAIPTVLFGLKGGQLADRRSRRGILLVTQAIMASLALGFAALCFSGTLVLAHVFVFAALLGLVAAFDLPALQSLAAELVPPEDIARAIGLMQAIFHSSRLVGPALAGIAIAQFGEGSAFLANGLSYFAVLTSLVLIGPATLRARKERPAEKKGGGGIGEGLAYVRNEPVLKRLLLLVFALMSLAFPFLVSLMPYFARYSLKAEAAAMGSIMSTSGLGALVGTALLVFAGGRWWRVRIGGGVLLITSALISLGHASTVAGAIPLVAALALGISLYMGTISQVVQQRVPNELRGRVMSLFTIGFVAIMPLSGFLLSIAADAFGLGRLMVGAGAVFGVLSASLALTIPDDPPAAGSCAQPAAH